MEDPETALKQMIREMEESILALRREAASAIASRKMLERRREKARADARASRENAELAVREGRDDLAKRALAKAKDSDRAVESLDSQLAEADGLVGRLKDELRRVEDKVQEARAKRDTLVAKKRLARHRKELADAADRAARVRPVGRAAYAEIIDGFDEIEERIEREIAEVEARTELDEELEGRAAAGEIEAMRREKELDEELGALKKRLKK
jgi:phage shock protein A